MRARPPQALTVVQPVDLPALPEPPTDLPAEAKVEYQRVARLLADEGMLTALDATILELYARTFADWKATVAQIEASGGPVVAMSTGPGQNPYLAVATARKRELLTIIDHLGLSPLARRKLARPAAVVDVVAAFAQARYAPPPAVANGTPDDHLLLEGPGQ